MYSIGIEEEFFVFDAMTRRAVRRLDKTSSSARKSSSAIALKTEMLQSQIEVATPPCDTIEPGARAPDALSRARWREPLRANAARHRRRWHVSARLLARAAA